MTNTILALIDGSEFSRPVLDLATYAATRNRAAVRLLHMRPPKSLPRVDLSGEIGLGARSTLLSELAALEEQRARLAMVRDRAIGPELPVGMRQPLRCSFFRPDVGLVARSAQRTARKTAAAASPI